MSKAPFAFMALLALAGCSGMTQPEDIAVATELCAKRGGLASVARYERGQTLTINCKDGLHLEARLHEVKS